MSIKVGIGIITCNRGHFFKELIESIPAVEEIVVVNDGKPYSNDLYPSKITEIIQHRKNKGIAKTKNDALKYLLNSSCRHIFLFEDDIAVKDHSLIQKYISASEKSGIYHFNYAYHGVSENRTSDGQPNPRLVVNYGNGIDIAFYRNTTAAMSYFRSEVLEKVGLIDTFYRNALEHVDHTYQIIKAGYHPPFRWFADLRDSHFLLRELDLLQNESLLKKNEKILLYRAKFFGAYFRLKNGYRPSRVPSVDEKEIYHVLEQLKTRNTTI